MTHSKSLFRTLTAILLTWVCGTANSAVIIDFSETGSDLTISLSGTLNTSGLSHLIYGGSAPGTSSINSGTSQDYIIFGASAAPIDRYDFSNTRLPVFAGTFSGIADSTSGDAFYFWNASNGSARLFLADTFVSGSSLSASMTFLNTSLADIGGVNTGIITLPGDTIEFTVNANTGGASVPNAPVTALLLAGLSGLGLRRRRG